jgi:hypothetical protein
MTAGLSQHFQFSAVVVDSYQPVCELFIQYAFEILVHVESGDLEARG